MVEDGYVNEGWLVVRKALLGTKKYSYATWHKAKAILDFVLAYVLKTQERETKEKIGYLNWEILKIIYMRNLCKKQA